MGNTKNIFARVDCDIEVNYWAVRVDQTVSSGDLIVCLTDDKDEKYHLTAGGTIKITYINPNDKIGAHQEIFGFTPL